MTLQPSRAGLRDDAAFAAFSCVAPGAVSIPWLEEVENYVRARLLRVPDLHVLAFRDDDELIAVSAFYETELRLPANRPASHPAWHLEVLAVAHARQRSGVGLEVLDHTLSVMRAIGPDRVFVIARAHVDNEASTGLCAKRAITRYMPDGAYWVLVGDIGVE